jgi:hypothetical protein
MSDLTAIIIVLGFVITVGGISAYLFIRFMNNWK